MKKELFTILLLLSTYSVVLSQGQVYCKRDSISNEKNSIQTLSLQKTETKFQEQSSIQSNSSGAIRTIPVVIHIIHQGGIENISDAQIFTQLDVLNKDFRRLNADTSNTNPIFLSVATDVEVEFCLASKDPLGNATNGIDRILTMNPPSSVSQVINMFGWDNKKYLNFYISNSFGSFSSFPWEPDSTDGIFMTHGRFGTIGTAGTEPSAEFAKFGRTATHEVGHYLGLHHTFDLTMVGCDTICASTGDNVCDTPPCQYRWFVSSCMPQSTNSCTESPDLPDQVDNYMDYNIDSCANMFSQGQKSRIDITLNLYRSTLWSNSNLIEVGCTGFVALHKNKPPTHFKIYPNPISQHATLEFDNLTNENFILTLYNTQGRLVKSISNINSSQVLINKADLVSGLYFFHLSTRGQVRFNGKLIIE